MVNLEIRAGNTLSSEINLNKRNSEYFIGLIRKITFIWTTEFETVLHVYRVWTCIVRYHPGI